MATVQFYQALRICEGAAIKWSCVSFDEMGPLGSRLHLYQHVLYFREKLSRIVNGLKNCDEKDVAMLPESSLALKSLYSPGKAGLIFADPETGTILRYHTVKNAYDRAFRRAGLPYTATFVMRHVGGRKVYNETGSDLEITKQHLGNSCLQSVLVYAKRSNKAHTEYVARKWGKAT